MQDFGKVLYGGFVTRNKVAHNLSVETNYLESKRKTKSESRASIFKRKPSAQIAFTKVSLKSSDAVMFLHMRWIELDKN